MSKTDSIRRKNVDLGTVKVYGLEFADDKVVTAELIESLQRMMSKPNTRMKNMGPKINAKKTKIIVFEGKGEKKVSDIILVDERIEQVETYVYFGSLFTTDGKIDGEIARRINEGRKIIDR